MTSRAGARSRRQRVGAGQGSRGKTNPWRGWGDAPGGPGPAERGGGVTPPDLTLFTCAAHSRSRASRKEKTCSSSCGPSCGAILLAEPRSPGSLPPLLDKPAHMRNLCRLLPLPARLSPILLWSRQRLTTDFFFIAL